MATPIWPVEWPEDYPPADANPLAVARAELSAANTMRFLTLGRVGGASITVMPCGDGCKWPTGFSTFHPILLDSGRIANCWCKEGCGCASAPAVTLVGPVGRIDEVRIRGEVLEPSAYRVENGTRLVRTDGGRWPTCAGDDFTVTYLNAYPVDPLGAYVAGLLAAEFLKAATGAKGCKLPSNVTSVSRQGVSYQLARGLFPDGNTGINEVDLYVAQWNPAGLRQRPTVTSIDAARKQRQVTWP